MSSKTQTIQNDSNILTQQEKMLVEKHGPNIIDMTLMDNVFMLNYFQDNLNGVTFILQKLLNRNDMQVTQVVTERLIKNLQGRDVKLDIFAVDKAGKQYNIEIQRADSGAIPKRARYHSSMMDYTMLKPKDTFNDLVETVVIFITEHDVMRGGQVIYHIDRTVKETGQVFDDEAHIIYVNGQCRDNSPIGKLMHDFNCADPEQMYYPEIAERAYRLKYEEKEVCKMAGVMERLLEEREQQVKGVMERLLEEREQQVKGVMETKQKEMTREFVLALLQDGTFSKEKIAQMTKVDLMEVEKLAEQL